MDTKKLKQKILDLAIHGKLVPQDPNDEPASALLARIREEKLRLIKEGKIKKAKKSDTSDTSRYGNVPFDVPEGWVWTNVETISKSILYGVSESAKSCGEYKLLRITDIQDNSVCWNNVPFTDYDTQKAKAYLLEDGDILFARTGATVGKSYLVSNLLEKAIYASYLIRVQTFKQILPSYIKLFFESGYYWEQITEGSVGVGQPNVNGSVLGSLKLPLPPLAEQHRIVAEIEKWFALIDTIESSKTDLQTAIKQAKSKILDLAIRGKLVPQDPADEPASELLKRINPKAQIATDIAHYQQLPSGWVLVPLKDISTTINGLWKGKKEPFVNVGVIRNANFTKDFQLDYSKIEYIDVEQQSFEKRHLLDGDIIVEKSGGSDNFPVGRAILYTGEDKKFSFSNFTMSLRILDKTLLLPSYLYYFLLAAYQKGEMRQMQTQTTGLHNLILDKFMNISVSIPPISEQHRIVAKIKELFDMLDAIAENL